MKNGESKNDEIFPEKGKCKASCSGAGCGGWTKAAVWAEGHACDGKGLEGKAKLLMASLALPALLYRAPGRNRHPSGKTYDVVGAATDAEVDALVARGWHVTKDEAFASAGDAAKETFRKKRKPSKTMGVRVNVARAPAEPVVAADEHASTEGAPKPKRGRPRKVVDAALTPEAD